MRKPTVLAQSEAVPSPNGEMSAVVSSLTSAKGSHSQVIVESAGGGSGLACVGGSRVALGLTWRDDDTLLVAYPDDLSLQNEWQCTFGPGGVGRAIYVPTPRQVIPPMQWTVTAELEVISEKRLARGKLTTMTFSGRRLYDYSYYDSSEPDSSADLLRSWGLQGGGETWAGIVRGLIEPGHQNVIAHLDIDPEADGIAIRSSKRACLLLVSERIAEAKRDPDVLRAAVEWARQADQIE